MNPERWKEIKLIVEKVLDLPEIERLAFIDKACMGDVEIKKEVESLLYFHNEMGEFLEKPVIPIAPVDVIAADNFSENSASKSTLINDGSLLKEGMILQERYLILEKIGQGGMGAVYKARDKRLNNFVALKQIIVSGERLKKAFRQEAQLLAKLRHPSLPTVIDYFTELDSQFLVMEFIDGETLSQLLSKRGKPFDLPQVISWFEQLLEALNYLHSHNPPIIHRDIKPNNLKLTKNKQIVLLDFGLAKGLSKTSDATNSNIESSIAGYTPHYAPLEQINGLGTDCRSDIYSTAATIYHLATNSKPPDATSRAIAILNREPDPLKIVNLLNPDINHAFAQLLSDCLSQNINQRPTSVKNLLLRLQALQNSSNNHTSNSSSTNIKACDTLEQSQINTLVASNQANETSFRNTLIKTVLNSDFRRKPTYLVLGFLTVCLFAILANNFLPIFDLEDFYFQPNQIKQASVLSGNSSNDRTNDKARPLPKISEKDEEEIKRLNRLLEAKHFGEPGFKGEPVSINIRDVELYSMLEFFSINYGLNFVVDESVPKMIVTMTVTDVPWVDALTSMLETNNLVYNTENNVVRIVPKSKPFLTNAFVDKRSSNKKDKKDRNN